MTHEQLEIFAVAAETLNFSETGRRLHLSQPTISQQMKTLESQLGQALFTRSGRGLALTLAGETLLPYARRVRQEVEAADSAMKALCGEVAGPLRLGASTTIGNYWLPSRLLAFKRAYPNVTASVIIENSAALLPLLQRGELHLLLLEGMRPVPPGDRFGVTAFMEDRLAVVASPDMSLPEPLDFPALARLPWVLREPGSGTREVLFQALEHQGISPRALNIVLELGGTEAIKRAVEAGVGVACISTLAVEAELASGALRALPLAGAGFQRSLWQVSPRERYLGPPA
ncbi:MAG TPA: LysR family transcriptional regulator, partial [Stenomitos sp.]